jgi:hypothetical protein
LGTLLYPILFPLNSNSGIYYIHDKRFWIF